MLARAPLSEAEWVTLFERAAHMHPLHRSLHMLAAAYRDTATERGQPGATDNFNPEQLAELDMADRNRQLMNLFLENFGAQLECESNCPQCDEGVELALDLRRVLADTATTTRTFITTTGGFHISYRLPNTRDLLVTARCGHAATARAELLAACIVRCERADDAATVDAGELPEEVLQHVAEQMGRCDPHAEILARLTCPECATPFRIMVDIADLLWAKIVARAKTALRAVHVLARAYGWSEADILNMSEPRRALYLSLVDA